MQPVVALLQQLGLSRPDICKVLVSRPSAGMMRSHSSWAFTKPQRASTLNNQLARCLQPDARVSAAEIFTSSAGGPLP